MGLILDQALQKGIEAHKGGQVQEADHYYTAILKSQPNHPDANHNMGILAVGVGKVEAALPFFKTALEANPKIEQFWLSYINALVKLDRLTDAKTMFDKAKSNGAKGDGFDRLEEQLRSSPFQNSNAQDLPKEQLQSLVNLYKQKKLQQVFEEAQILTKRYTKSLALWNLMGASAAQIGELDEAVVAFQKVISIDPKNALALNNMGNAFRKQDKLDEAIKAYNKALSLNPDLTQAYYNMGIALKNHGKLDEAIKAYNKAISLKPDYTEAYNNLGVALQDQGKLDEAIKAYNKAISLNPDYTKAYNNLGVALQDQGKLDEAIKAFGKAISLNPDNAEAYNNMGNALQEQGKLDEAIEALSKAVSLKPGFAEAYYNMGAALREQGKLNEAIEAYTKAISLKNDYADSYYNMGIALREQGKLDDAIEACNKAITIKPDFAEAHRHLSSVTKYNHDTAQISKVEALLQRTGLNDSDRCNLLYTHAKMQEDLGDLSAAFDSYVKGGDLRQKLLKYEFTQDEQLFDQTKRTAPQFKDVALNVTGEPIRHSPIFILGMPRSGTTLVEQIVSSHSEVTGAGELEYVTRYGAKLVAGLTSPTLEAVSTFRERYLVRLAERADGQAFITDKMPQNFQYIPLICAAFPEAKIVHVQRSAEATCWSNFKHYFASTGLGYCYSLRDTIAYYGLYKELMHFFSQSYIDRIYNLDYDKLTEDQEPETRRLIEYLELNWEDACLAPQNNKRSVKTASQQQVRQKVYKGSSEAWRKYEPFLNGAFDGLKST